jgi:hypothetical protein
VAALAQNGGSLRSDQAGAADDDDLHVPFPLFYGFGVFAETSATLPPSFWQNSELGIDARNDRKKNGPYTVLGTAHDYRWRLLLRTGVVAHP